MKPSTHDATVRHAAADTYYPQGHALRRAITILRRAGWRSFAWRLASECGYRRLVLLARTLTDAPADPTVPPGITVEELGRAHAAAYVAAYVAVRPGSDAEAVRQRFERGHRCFVARRGTALLSSCWAATHGAWIAYLERDLPLEPGDVYFYDAFTAAEARGARLAPLVAALQLRTFRAEGYRRAVRTTDPENVPALRAHAKSGFVPIAMLARIRVGPWRHHVRRPWRGA